MNPLVRFADTKNGIYFNFQIWFAIVKKFLSFSFADCGCGLRPQTADADVRMRTKEL